MNIWIGLRINDLVSTLKVLLVQMHKIQLCNFISYIHNILCYVKYVIYFTIMFKFNCSLLYLVDSLIMKTILYIMFYWYDVHLQFYMLSLYILFFLMKTYVLWHVYFVFRILILRFVFYLLSQILYRRCLLTFIWIYWSFNKNTNTKGSRGLNIAAVYTDEHKCCRHNRWC